MSFLKSLPAEAGLLQIFQAFPEIARPLIEYHEVLLRGESPFTPAQRELIAAYVSGLNNCNYCRAVHSETAVALGIKPQVMTNTLSNLKSEDVDEIYSAGWDDRAVHDATAVCGLFNLMNRLVNGLGVEASESYTKLAAQRLANGGYAQLLNFLPATK